MVARAFLLKTPDGRLRIFHPNYFDGARKLAVPGTQFGRDAQGAWIVWGGGVTLRQAEGELFADSGDIWDVSDTSVFLESQQQLEQRTLAKMMFELSRPWLQPPTSMSESQLSQWRMNSHWSELEGLIEIPCVHLGDCEREALPTDRYFREVWQVLDVTPNEVTIDMPKARGIHMDRIRVARNAELAAKDITFMRAVEAGDTDTQATIATEKQTLRDIPQTFDLTTDTPEQLKAKWPTELPARE